jgi:hypothetical protein
MKCFLFMKCSDVRLFYEILKCVAEGIFLVIILIFYEHT